MLIKCRLN